MWIRVETDGKTVRMTGNVASHQQGVRLLWAAIGSFLSEMEAGKQKEEAKSANDDWGSELKLALSKSGSWGPTSDYANLLRSLCTMLLVNGVVDDMPSDVQPEIVRVVSRALSADTPEAAEVVMPLRDVLTVLLAVTRRKQTRGRIAMAKGGDEITPQQVLSELLQLRQEWRTSLKGLGFEMEGDSEAGEE